MTETQLARFAHLNICPLELSFNVPSEVEGRSACDRSLLVGRRVDAGDEAWATEDAVRTADERA